MLGIGNDEYLVVIEAYPDEFPEDYVPESTSRHTHIIASDDYEWFTFISRIRSWQEQKRGNVEYRKFSIEAEAFRQGLDNEAQILDNINAIRYRSSTPPIERLWDGSKRALS